MQTIWQITLARCVEFQEMAAQSAEQARMFLDGRDRYKPRVIQAQRNAAFYHEEARIRLERLIGVN